MSEHHRNLAEHIRDACARTAEEAYEDAGIQGLCAEGRWECALDAIRALDLGPLLQEISIEPVRHDPAEGPDGAPLSRTIRLNSE